MKHWPFYSIIVLSTLFSLALGQILSSGEDVKDFMKKQIEENEVMVFSTSNSQYCDIVKHLLNSQKTKIGYSVTIIELDEQNSNDGEIIQNALKDLTGQASIPNVFIGGNHVGGSRPRNPETEDFTKFIELENMLGQAIDASRSLAGDL